jgi:photosystem II protein
MAEIRFSQMVREDVVPDVKLTRSRTGDSGKATFYFESPNALADGSTEDITGMYLIDEEGQLTTRDVNAKFVNGQPVAIEAIYLMRSALEWERFMRFMERYAEENGLGFTKSD